MAADTTIKAFGRMRLGLSVAATQRTNFIAGWPIPEFPGPVTFRLRQHETMRMVWDGSVWLTEVNFNHLTGITYSEIGNGFVEMRGSAVVPANGTVEAVLPLAAINTNYTVVLSQSQRVATPVQAAAETEITVGLKQANQFRLHNFSNADRNVQWIGQAQVDMTTYGG